MIISSKPYSIILTALVVLLAACGCEKPQPQTEPEGPVMENPDMSLVTQSVPVTDDWIWSGRPQITVHIENKNPEAVKLGVKTQIKSDKKESIATIEDSVIVSARGARDYVVTTTEDLVPGFYRAICTVNGRTARNFFFGIDPFRIVSNPDKQPDFDAFWKAAKDQLAAVDMKAQLTEIESKSSDVRKVYLVEMQSVPDGLSGEPVTIRGYYCEPQDGKKHPVIMHYYGYDTQGSKGKCECPNGGSSDYAEFYLSHRGQYLNNRPAGTNPGIDEATENIYGDWFSYNFGQKDSYYYRGAFMDVVQSIRFMATRGTSNMDKLFAEGSSQGGALTYAAAALSDYPFTAIAANVAFLGDFADAMAIGGLAAETAKSCAKSLSLTDEQMLTFLSYFDTKNLATRISCAVMASSGLQDGVCPPRTNVVPFNNLKTPEANKKYVWGPEMGHDYPSGWNPILFFKKYM